MARQRTRFLRHFWSRCVPERGSKSGDTLKLHFILLYFVTNSIILLLKFPNKTQTVQKIDEDVKAKAYTFTDVKTSLQNANKAKSSGGTLATAELVEVLTPEVVRVSSFVIAGAHLSL